MFFIRLFLANTWEKNRGSPCSFERKGAFISLSGLVWVKSLTFCMCTCSCARANDAKIVRSRDAQCNTKLTLCYWHCDMRVRIHRESMILTTFTLLSLCHDSQRKSEKCSKNRDVRAEPSFLQINPFVFGRVLVAWQRETFHPIARHRRFSLDGRGIFDSGRSLQV